MNQRRAREIFVKSLLNHRRSREIRALCSLWKNCARDVNDSVLRTASSHTFRLPATHQSGTIPRCLIAAVKLACTNGQVARETSGARQHGTFQRGLNPVVYRKM